MGHHRRSRKSKPNVKVAGTITTAARNGNKQGVPKAASQHSQVPAPQLDLTPGARPAHESLAGLSNEEWDSLFCMAIRHHFEQEKVWIPSVLRTMPLLEGINDKTGRPCRIYVRPNRRILMVETLL